MMPAEQSRRSGDADNAFLAHANSEAVEIEYQAIKADAPSAIVIVEREAFHRDCLLYSVASHWPGDAAAFASLSELAQVHADRGSTVVLLSIISLSEDEAAAELARLMDLDPPVRSMVLAKADDLNEAYAALSHGANGYISTSAGFEVFIQALRFVAAGGTYVPPQCLLLARQAQAVEPEHEAENAITTRELAVIKAIRQGKPNKVIAYELNMCESTVKVHVRHIMKKLHARNRTEVAIKGADVAMAGASAHSA
jgi:DNA-binding NarL/FixJ family response regulator